MSKNSLRSSLVGGVLVRARTSEHTRCPCSRRPIWYGANPPAWATQSFSPWSSSSKPLNIRLAIITVESYGLPSKLVR